MAFMLLFISARLECASETRAIASSMNADLSGSGESQRLFDGQHRAQHVIILLLDRCELLALHAQRLGLFIEVHGNLRDVFGLHDKVFHLIQQLDQLQVKVDGQLRALDIRGEQRKR
eukprot:858364-Prymnesium_polylepis.1